MYSTTDDQTTAQRAWLRTDKIYLSSPMLDGLPWIMNAFSTRLGGVSEGIYAQMNLSHTVGDDPEKVLQNYRIFGKEIGVPAEDMVLAHQTHTVNVMAVGTAHKGMGIVKDRNYHDIDGIMTDVPGVCLVTSHADCVPLYFVDPVNRAIALAHSGWKGTVGNICKNTVEAMKEHYGTDPKELLAVIGPAIGVECYEVSFDVAERFQAAYNEDECRQILFPKENEKYDLNLSEANQINMLRCGLLPEHIECSGLCTRCSFDWLHSHRGSGGKRGGMGAFLMIRQTAE